jgi:hypothetical protein
MMEKQKTIQESLFSYNVSLDARVRKDHVLRKIQQSVDFGFIYKEVGATWGRCCPNNLLSAFLGSR